MGTKLIEMGEIKFKELSANIKILNDSGFIDDKKINAVGKTKEELVDLFVKAVQGIPDDKNGDWPGPEAVALYYMSLLAPDDKKEKGEKANKKKKAVETDKKEKEKVVQVPKAKGTEKGTGINEYGFREGSASARASILIMSGEHTVESAAKVIEEEFGKSPAIALGRIKMIIRALKRDKGVDPNWKGECGAQE
jgi:hypothetical protein